MASGQGGPLPRGEGAAAPAISPLGAEPLPCQPRLRGPSDPWAPSSSPAGRACEALAALGRSAAPLPAAPAGPSLPHLCLLVVYAMLPCHACFTVGSHVHVAFVALCRPRSRLPVVFVSTLFLLVVSPCCSVVFLVLSSSSLSPLPPCSSSSSSSSSSPSSSPSPSRRCRCRPPRRPCRPRRRRCRRCRRLAPLAP